jgi:ABC-type Fe3+/spermidine/putrescine transport system ATPase subunit
LSKAFQVGDLRVSAVRAVNLDVTQGEFFVLLGPSGCGKTTMLRSIAGLERPDTGEIRINGEVVFSSRERLFVPPERRSIAMVFQSYAVWPHMNVYENVAFPLREGVRRLPPDQVRLRAAEVLDLLALADLAERPVTTLSGGQQQRVALARALALRPKILLMDEPLSNLDYKLQIRLRTQLKELMHRLRLTTVYVTHNQAEAMEIGDRIAVMDRGAMVQAGTPRDVYRLPHDEFVARFIGEMGLLPATMTGMADGYALLDTAAGSMRARAVNGAAPPGTSCYLGMRPEDLVLLANGALDRGNVIEGEVVQSRFVGEATIYSVRVGASVIAFKAHHSIDLAPGARVRLAAAPEYCVAVLPALAEASPYAGEDELGLAERHAH